MLPRKHGRSPVGNGRARTMTVNSYQQHRLVSKVYRHTRNEPILLLIGTRDALGKRMKWSTLGPGGQRSRSHDAEVPSRGLAEASFSSLDPFSSLHMWLRARHLFALLMVSQSWILPIVLYLLHYLILFHVLERLSWTVSNDIYLIINQSIRKGLKWPK